MIDPVRPDVDVRRAEPTDTEPAAAVLAAAFVDYPWTTWTVDADDHEDRLRRLYLATLERIAIPYGEVWVAESVEPEPRILAVAGWLTPRTAPPPEVWPCLAAIEQELRGRCWQRHLRAEERLEKLRPAGPAWLLGTVGVLPAERGRGLATRLLDRGLAAADAAAEPAYLETSAESNVTLYHRLGFEVVGCEVVEDGAPTVWAMRREAAHT